MILIYCLRDEPASSMSIFVGVRLRYVCVCVRMCAWTWGNGEYCYIDTCVNSVSTPLCNCLFSTWTAKFLCIMLTKYMTHLNTLYTPIKHYIIFTPSPRHYTNFNNWIVCYMINIKAGPMSSLSWYSHIISVLCYRPSSKIESWSIWIS